MLKKEIKQYSNNDRLNQLSPGGHTSSLLSTPACKWICENECISIETRETVGAVKKIILKTCCSS